MPADGSPRGLTVTARPGGGRRAELRAGTGPHAEVHAEAELGADGAVELLRVSALVAPKAPPVWFAELRENSAAPPAVNLLAFTGAGQRPHTVLDRTALSNVAVGSADQLGAVRFYPGSGEVDQVYVQPAWRRHSIGTVLVLAASTLSVAREWPRLWGDGQRTELGEAWRNASVWRDRTGELTHVAPPMTPGTTSS